MSEATRARHPLDRRKPAAEVASIAVVAVLSLAAGVVLVRSRGFTTVHVFLPV
jgi:hypothetical protein